MRAGDRQSRERARVRAPGVVETYQDAEAAIAFKEIACSLATQRRAHYPLHVCNRKSVARESRAIGGNAQERKARQLLKLCVRRAVDPREHRLNSFAEHKQQTEVIAVHLDRNIGTHTGDEFVETHLYRLCELVIVAGYLRRSGFELAHQLLFGLARIRPCRAGLHHHERVRDAKAAWGRSRSPRCRACRTHVTPPASSSSAARERSASATACVRLVPGMRNACSATSPSSRFGMNSRPMRVAAKTATTTSAADAPSIISRARSARSSSGS